MPELLTFSDAGVPLLITLVFVLAGVVKGVVGLGLPTIAMALLALMMAPAHAAALLIVPSLVTNIWQLSPWAGLNSLLRRLAPMQLGLCAGTLAGAWLLENQRHLLEGAGAARRKTIEELVRCPHVPMHVRSFEEFRDCYLKEDVPTSQDDRPGDFDEICEQLFEVWLAASPAVNCAG